MATTRGATVTFTGDMQTTDQSINIINNDGLNNVGRRWNLVSNPFPSYIAGNTAAGATNFMDANSAVIDSEFLAVMVGLGQITRFTISFQAHFQWLLVKHFG